MPIVRFVLACCAPTRSCEICVCLSVGLNDHKTSYTIKLLTQSQAVAEFQGQYMNTSDLVAFFSSYVPDDNYHVCPLSARHYHPT